MPTQPISYVKSHLADSISAVRETGEPMRITQNGVETAVLVDAEAYDRTQRALLMLKLVAQGERDAREGTLVPQAEVFATLRARYANRSATPSKTKTKRAR